MSGGSAMGVASYPSANSSTVVEYQHPLEDKALTALAGSVPSAYSLRDVQY